MPEETQGTETSQYLEERKSTETPLVAASERGCSPNQAGYRLGSWGRSHGMNRTEPKSFGKSHQSG
jgi:hypothetical protein